MSNDELKIVVFVGMPGSGKSYCVKYLEEKSLPSVYFGGITLDEMKKRGMKINETNEKMVREELRTTDGKEVYATRIIEKIDQLESKNQQRIVVDGLYSWSEYKMFKQKYGDKAIVIAVAAPRNLRHQRLAKRPDRPLTEDEANKRDYAEIENIEKGGPIANADYTLINDSTPKEMTNKLDQILQEVRFI